MFFKMNFEYDLYKDDICTRLEAFSPLLENSNKHPKILTRLFDLPICFFRKQIVSTPYRLPIPKYTHMIEYKKSPVNDILKTSTNKRNKHLTRPAACLFNIASKTNEPLILECSSASLDLVFEKEMDCNGNISRISSCNDTSNTQSSGKPLQTRINMFSITEQQFDRENLAKESLTHLSTSSSNSSTREVYLPAATGSTDTFKVADALGETNAVCDSQNTMNSKNDFLNMHQLNDSNSLKERKYIPQRGITPPTLRDYSNASKNCINMPFFFHDKGFEISQNMRWKNEQIKILQNINREEICSNQLSVVLRKQDKSIPQISIDKLYNEMINHLHMNSAKGEVKSNLKKKINVPKKVDNAATIKSQKDPSDINYFKDLPGPSDWMREIKNNKFILQQEIIENVSSHSSSITLSNEFQSSSSSIPTQTYLVPKVAAINKNMKQKKFKRKGRQHIPMNIKPVYYYTVPDNKLGNEKKRKCHKSDSRIKQSDGILNAGVSLSSNDSFISSRNKSDCCMNIDLQNISSKFRKLNGFTEIGSQKPGIKKLLVSSDLVLEGSGSGPEEEENNKRRKRLHNVSARNSIMPKLVDYGEQMHQLIKHPEQVIDSGNRLKDTKQTPASKYLTSDAKRTSEEDGIYTESLLTEKFNFQKLREIFEYKKPEKCNTFASRVLGENFEKNEQITDSIKCLKVPGEDAIITNKSVDILCKTDKASNSLEPLEATTKNDEINIKNCAENIISENKEAENSWVFNEKTLKISEGFLMSKNGQTAHLYDKCGLPYTDFKGRLLKNNLGIPVLKVKSYQDLFTNNMSVYDANNKKLDESGFDPSIKPKVNTLVRITDRMGNPASLYNNLGLPLTDEDGLLLHNSSGEILVSLDSRFFPLCCKNGTPVYLRNGSTWLSQRYKYIVTTQNRANELDKKTDLTNFKLSGKEKSEKLKYSSKSKQNVTAKDIIPMFNYTEKKAISTQYSNPDKLNYSKPDSFGNNNGVKKRHSYRNNEVSITGGHFQQELFPNKSHFQQLSNRINYTIFDKDGNRLTDENGYPLRNMYGEPLLLFDNNGIAICDVYGDPIFNSEGEQLMSSILQYSNTYNNESCPVDDVYICPERPYCEQTAENKGSYMTSASKKSSRYTPNHFENSYDSYKDSEPLIKLLERNDIRAWDIHNEVPTSVQSMYSLGGHSYKNLNSPPPGEDDYIKSKQGHQNYIQNDNRFDYNQINLPKHNINSYNSFQKLNNQYYTEYADEISDSQYFYELYDGDDQNNALEKTGSFPQNAGHVLVYYEAPNAEYNNYPFIGQTQFY